MQKISPIILFIFLFVLAWSLMGFSFSPLSVVFDNFNDNSTDYTKWLTTVVGDGPIISEEEGRLAITIPANSEDAPAQSFFGAGYLSICLLRGDFDLQVDYSLIDWSSSNGVRVGLSLDSNYEVPREYNVERVSFGNMDFLGEPREVYFYEGRIIETAHLSGTLRIKRVAALLTGYYMDGGNWVTLDTTPVTQADLHFGVSTWSHSYVFTNQNVKMAFDNLTILQGTVICPNESTPTVTLIATPTFPPTAIPTHTQTATSTPTATHTPILPTATETMPTIVTPGSVYLPMVSKFDTPTPTETQIPPTPSPTGTPSHSGGDTTPPQIATWDFSPTTVDTSNSDQTVTFTARFTDDLSGLTDGIIGGSGVSPTQARFRSPSGHQFADVLFQPPNDLISGTPQDGIYASAMILPRFSETGLWQLESLLLVDDVDNYIYLTRSVLKQRGLPVSISVRNDNK